MIVLARHGRTTANAEGRLLGRLDPPLDAEGERQAAAVAAAVAASVGDRAVRIVSSPLVRTMATAAAIVAAVDVDVEVDERWIELDYGVYDGVPMAEVPASVWATWRTDPEFCPEGGECLSAVGRRVRAACDELAPAAVDTDIVVVTHVSPIKAAVAWALGVDDLVAWRLYLGPGSITRIGVRDTGPALTAFNYIPGQP